MFIIDRLVRFYKKNGAVLFCKHTAVKIWKIIFIKPDVIYFAELSDAITPQCCLPEVHTVVERDAVNPLSAQEMEQLGGYIGSKILVHQIRQRFSLGATLWLLKRGDTCMGMIWTLVGKTIEPYYYFIGQRDVHFFNNEIFEPYRGKGFNPPLIEYVLFQMKARGFIRACIETNQRNIAEQRSLSKTRFRPVGKALKYNLGKRNITLWSSVASVDK